MEITEARLWANGFWDQLHSLGLGLLLLVLLGQEDTADQPSRPCISLKVLNPVYLPRASPIPSGEWDLHVFLCIYSTSCYIFYTGSTRYLDRYGPGQPGTSSPGCQGGGLVQEIAPEMAG